MEPIRKSSNTKKVHPSISRLIIHNENREYVAKPLPDLSTYQSPNQPVWVHISGLGTPKAVTLIAEHFNLHPLIIEDILTPPQRPKIEDYGHALYIVVRNYALENNRHFISDQVSIVFGEHFILTIQEGPGDPFDTVLKLLNQRGEHCASTNDIAHLFIDVVVDQLTLVIDTIGHEIEKLEDQFLELPDRAQVKVVHGLRKEMTRMRRSLWSLHEAIGQLLRCTSTLLHESTHAYLRDIEDHVHRAMESVEGFRDSTSELLDLYMSATNNRMNEVIKVLTIISTIFIPLNFIAAIYGMNFKYMPELDWVWGYPLFWVIICSIGAGMMGFFWRKGWL